MAAVKGHTINTGATAHLLSQLTPTVWGGRVRVCVSELSEAVLAPRDSGYKLENEEGRVDLFGIAVAVVVLVVQMGLEKGLKSHVLKKKLLPSIRKIQAGCFFVFVADKDNTII